MIRSLVRYRLRRATANAELVEEVRAHLAIERQRRIDSGEPPDAAEAGALKDFRNVTRAGSAETLMNASAPARMTSAKL